MIAPLDFIGIDKTAAPSLDSRSERLAATFVLFSKVLYSFIEISFSFN
jgi:hypothetical protein